MAEFTIETEIPTNVPSYIRIPKFMSSDVLHTRIANLCEKGHSLSSTHERLELEQIQTELDRLAARIYNLSDSETLIFRKSLEMIA